MEQFKSLLNEKEERIDLLESELKAANESIDKANHLQNQLTAEIDRLEHVNAQLEMQQRETELDYS
jgi:chromosome segregation ATPase